MKSIKFLPENLQDKELFKKFCELLDKVIEKEDELIQPILQKLDPENLEDIEDVYKEFGFDYLTNLLRIEETSKILATYFSLLRTLKGKRSGLELLFQLLGWDYEITEWWEKDPPGILYTAEVKVTFNINEISTKEGSIIGKFKHFFRSYVYPLVTLYVEYVLPSLNYGIGTIGFVRNKNYDTVLDINHLGTISLGIVKKSFSNTTEARLEFVHYLVSTCSSFKKSIVSQIYV
jgi:hypothetical protein